MYTVARPQMMLPPVISGKVELSPICMCMHNYMCMCLHVYVCMCLHVYVDVCMCLHVYARVCMCM